MDFEVHEILEYKVPMNSSSHINIIDLRFLEVGGKAEFKCEEKWSLHLIKFKFVVPVPQVWNGLLN